MAGTTNQVLDANTKAKELTGRAEPSTSCLASELRMGQRISPEQLQELEQQQKNDDCPGYFATTDEMGAITLGGTGRTNGNMSASNARPLTPEERALSDSIGTLVADFLQEQMDENILFVSKDPTQQTIDAIQSALHAELFEAFKDQDGALPSKEALVEALDIIRADWIEENAGLRQEIERLGGPELRFEVHADNLRWGKAGDAADLNIRLKQTLAAIKDSR